MSTTPETDKAVGFGVGGLEVVPSGFARRLERQRDRARLDTARLDWLADRHNPIGNVQLPREIVEANIDSLRGAIDAAMKLIEKP